MEDDELEVEWKGTEDAEFVDVLETGLGAGDEGNVWVLRAIDAAILLVMVVIAFLLARSYGVV